MINEKKYQVEDGEHKGEVIVSWIITHRCPEKCAYCISPCQSSEIESFEKHLAIQNQMINTGLKKVPHLLQLVKEASMMGVDTRISTNGILLTKEKIIFIRDYINSFAFPFESMDDQLNKQIRGPFAHRQIVTDRINMVKDLTNAGVLVNTCVHKENLQKLAEVGYHLQNIGVDHWKLRKFYSGSGRGAVPNKERFEISDEQFLSVVDMLKKLYPNMRIDGRLPSKLQTRLMVSPQGELYRMIGQEESENYVYGKVLEKKLNIKDIYMKDGCN